MILGRKNMVFRWINSFWKTFFWYDRNFKTGRKLNGLLLLLGLGYKLRYKILRNFKIIKRPINSWNRIKHAKPILESSQKLLSLNNGFSLFNMNEIPNGRKTLTTLTTLWKQRSKNPLPEMDWFNKSPQPLSLRNCLVQKDFIDYPEIGRLATCDLFLHSATKYLSAVPTLATIQLLWSVVDDSMTGSQQYHIDEEDKSQIKFYIALTDINEESGPTHFIPKSLSSKIKQSVIISAKRDTRMVHSTTGRVSDSTIHSLVKRTDIKVATCQAGQGYAVDTAQCFHMGSRVKKGERAILLIQYLPYNTHQESSGSLPNIDPKNYSDSPITLLALERY